MAYLRSMRISCKVRDNDRCIWVCKTHRCSRKSLGNKSYSRHICRFCNELKFKSAKTCKFHLCQFGYPRRKCNSPPKIKPDKSNKYVVAILKSTVFPLDIILNVIAPYAGIADSMCSYHLHIFTQINTYS